MIKLFFKVEFIETDFFSKLRFSFLFYDFSLDFSRETFRLMGGLAIVTGKLDVVSYGLTMGSLRG